MNREENLQSRIDTSTRVTINATISTSFVVYHNDIADSHYIPGARRSTRSDIQRCRFRHKLPPASLLRHRQRGSAANMALDSPMMGSDMPIFWNGQVWDGDPAGDMALDYEGYKWKVKQDIVCA